MGGGEGGVGCPTKNLKINKRGVGEYCLELEGRCIEPFYSEISAFFFIIGEKKNTFHTFNFKN